jgi:Ankyrin repeats (many copies)
MQQQQHREVQLLIEHGADVNATRAVGKTPLLIAVLEGRVDQAKALIDAGADVNATFLLGFLGSGGQIMWKDTVEQYSN